jgi:hypothetical protein
MHTPFLHLCICGGCNFPPLSSLRLPLVPYFALCGTNDSPSLGLPFHSGLKLSPDAQQELKNNKAKNQAWQEKVERFKRAHGALSTALRVCLVYISPQGEMAFPALPEPLTFPCHFTFNFALDNFLPSSSWRRRHAHRSGKLPIQLTCPNSNINMIPLTPHLLSEFFSCDLAPARRRGDLP